MVTEYDRDAELLSFPDQPHRSAASECMQVNEIRLLFCQDACESEGGRTVSVPVDFPNICDLSRNGEAPHRNSVVKVRFVFLPRRRNQDVAVLVPLLSCQCLDVDFGSADGV